MRSQWRRPRGIPTGRRHMKVFPSAATVLAARKGGME